MNHVLVLQEQENAIAEIAPRTLLHGGFEDLVTRHRYDAENRLVLTILPDGRGNETRYTSYGKAAGPIRRHG